MTNNVIPLHPKHDPLPKAAYELCPGPCDDGDTCFCALGMDLVCQGIGKLREKWPALTKEDATVLVAEMVAGSASTIVSAEDWDGGGANADAVQKLSSALIDQVVSHAFGSLFDTADLDARLRAEWDARNAIKAVLRVRVRELERSRRPA